MTTETNPRSSLPASLVQLVQEDARECWVDFHANGYRTGYVSDDMTWPALLAEFRYWEGREGCTTDWLSNLLPGDQRRVLAAMVTEWFRYAETIPTLDLC